MRTATAGPVPAGVGQVRLTLRSILVAEEGEGQIEIPNRSGPINRTVRRVVGLATSAEIGRLEWFELSEQPDSMSVTVRLQGPGGPAPGTLGLRSGGSEVGALRRHPDSAIRARKAWGLTRRSPARLTTAVWVRAPRSS